MNMTNETKGKRWKNSIIESDNWIERIKRLYSWVILFKGTVVPKSMYVVQSPTT